MSAQIVKFAESSCPSVIALHCSGGLPSQWNALADSLAKSQRVFAPEHIHASEYRQKQESLCASSDFSLQDEAERSLASIDHNDRPVHLVGHSYGGAVALYLASVRPNKVASVTLYEPCVFNLLSEHKRKLHAEWAEIKSISSAVLSNIACGDYRAAMNEFVDYWNGPNSWNSMSAGQQDHIASWAPKAAMEFKALLRNKTAPHGYRRLRMPVRILAGTESPKPVISIAELLVELIPDCQVRYLKGMGHMGPVTHAPKVAQLIASCIEGEKQLILNAA